MGSKRVLCDPFLLVFAYLLVPVPRVLQPSTSALQKAPYLSRNALDDCPGSLFSLLFGRWRPKGEKGGTPGPLQRLSPIVLTKGPCPIAHRVRLFKMEDPLTLRCLCCLRHQSSHPRRFCRALSQPEPAGPAYAPLLALLCGPGHRPTLHPSQSRLSPPSMMSG